ncbi:AfsR/SARP family transcriptional regulator [Dactylosporangium sp. CA-139066]|uniref:AfsR/SARP family transcriptional regulator n=1 Tax=Dactylosporangium sp. CA-139066 TaxID=3239930 RepID=UPI003D8EE308
MRIVGRLLAGLMGGVLLLAALAVLPALLVVIMRAVDWDWRGLVAEPMSAPGALAALVGAGWLVWLAALRAVMADVIAAVRAGPARVVRLPVPLHTAVTATVGGVLLAVQAARGGTVATPAAASPGPAVTAGAATTSSPAPDSDGTQPGPVVRADAGVRVPGGWLPWPLVAAIAATVTLAWAYRRRRYEPRPPTGWQRHDPDLPEPDAAGLRLLSAVQLAVDHEPEIGEAAATTPRPSDNLPPHEADAGHPYGVADAWLPRGVLALLGTGRYDAARGLLIALLVQPPDLRPGIVCTPQFAATVLGAGHVPIHAPSADRAGPRAAADTVLFAVGPGRIEADAVAAHEVGSGRLVGPVTALSARRTIQLTATDLGSSWHVGEDGATRAAAGRTPRVGRLPVLDQAATITLLTSLGILPPATATEGAAAASGAAGCDVAEAADVPAAWPDPPPAEAAAERRLLIQVLGEPQVLRPHPDGTHSPVGIRRTAGRQILVLLALHRAGVNADVLKEAIWPDVPSAAAHRRFLTTMSELGRALHTAAGRTVLRHDDAAGITPRRYRLDPAAAQVDIWHLQDLVTAAVTSADPDTRRALLQAAAGLNRGELAAGWDRPWLLPDRERLARHLLDIVVELADTEPDHSTALRLLRQALRLAPGNDAVYQRILQRHADAGDADGLRRTTAALAEHRTSTVRPPEPYPTGPSAAAPHAPGHTDSPSDAGRPAATERSST